MISLSLIAALAAPVEQPQVLLFADLGMTNEIWEIPQNGGLASALRGEGWSVEPVAVPAGYRPDRPEDQVPTPRARAAIGLGLGGYRAARMARKLGIQRLVLVGAPVAWGGSPRATKVFFAIDRTTDWNQVATLGLQGPTTRRSLAQLLLTHGLPSRLHTPFRERALTPIHAQTLKALRSLDVGPVPQPNDALRAIEAAPEIEVLVITSMADGLFPAWQCDPAALGLRRENIERHYFTRANDNAREYNHLDLLLHPRAFGEVHPVIVEWLGRPAAVGRVE